MRVILEVIEWHKLHDICSHVLTVGLRVEGFLIAIKDLHRAEISIADAHDNDGDWESGASHDLIDGLLHVVDNTVGEDEQDVILLVHLADLGGLHLAVHLVENLIEIGWSVQVGVLQGFLVMTDHFCDAVDARVEDVSVEGEAVRSTSWVGWNSSAEAV